MTIKIPRMEFIDALGSVVEVSYSVRRIQPGGPIECSQILPVRVDPQAIDLPEPQISADRTRVTVHYPSMLTGHSVRVRRVGVNNYDSEGQEAETGGGGNVFEIPGAWIAENKGRTVPVNYKVSRRIGG